MLKVKKSPLLKATSPKLMKRTPMKTTKTLSLKRINSMSKRKSTKGKARNPFKSKPLKMKIFKNNEKFTSLSSNTKPVKARRLKTLPITKRLKTMPDTQSPTRLTANNKRRIKTQKIKIRALKHKSANRVTDSSTNRKFKLNKIRTTIKKS
jgi:hypothetical protein